MSTSLYGTVKKIGSSQFTFDKIYSNRVEMETNIANDKIYHGRYVFISYGDNLSTNSSNGETITITNNNNSFTYSTSYTTDWTTNYNIDIARYNNVYDKTVWQKIFEGTTEKYIMVASLNARAPGLTINEDYYSFQLLYENNAQDNEISHDYYIKGQEGAVSKIARYPLPKWHETYSNDLIYHLDMPMPLKLNLADEIDYQQGGFNLNNHLDPALRSSRLDPDNNYIRWEHILKDGSTTEVEGADFACHLPAIGQTMSDLYDAMFGLPVLNGQNQYERPNAPTDIADAIAQTGSIGVIGILANLNLDDQANGYALTSNWTETNNHGLGYIKNKPQKITNISVASSGLWTFTVVDNA